MIEKQLQFFNNDYDYDLVTFINKDESMEKTASARRSDYVDCYDQDSGEWYEVTLPEGPYWTEYEPVMFWDMNDDGMIDFAARREDGSWNLLTFVQE